jgi:hypothetical protein
VMVSIPIALIVCVQCWRGGLREAVRGERRPLGWPVGLGLGIGLAIAPTLTLQAAVGNFANGTAGWVGYLAWSFLLTAGIVLVVRWVADSSRLRVASLLDARSPAWSLTVHVTLTAVTLSLLLSVAAVLLPLLTTLGASVLTGGLPWLQLPQALGWSWLGLVPLLLTVTAVAVALLSRHRLERAAAARSPDTDEGAWFWADPTAPEHTTVASGPLPAPRTAALVIIGAVVGAASGLVLLATRYLGLAVDESTRASAAFVVALGEAQTAAVVGATVVAAAAGAAASRGLWWPLGLVSAAVGGVLAGSAAVAVNVAAGCGVLPAVRRFCAPPDWGLTFTALLEPVTQAAAVAFLTAALVGAVRALPRARSATTQLTHDHEPSAEPRPRALTSASVVGAVVAILWAGSQALGLLTVSQPVILGPGYTVELPAQWQAFATAAGPAFVDVASDVRVDILPAPSAPGPVAGESIVVGGLTGRPVGVSVDGVAQQRLFLVLTGDGPYLVSLLGTPSDLDRRADDVETLLSAVTWTTN